MTEKADIPDALLATLRDARHVCVLTGAGVSAESGVLTFRDAQEGLWAKYEPQDLATPEAFLADPALVWRWYRWRRTVVRDVEPNAGHHALVKLERIVPKLTLVTQNVDNLHQQAGSQNVIEFHGNLFDNRCLDDGSLQEASETEETPACPACGGHLRPGVVWFGENIPESALRRSFEAAMACDVFLSIGTSSLVYPAAGLADIASQNSAVVVEINPNPTLHAQNFDYAIAGNSGTVLPELVDLLTR